MYWQIHEGHCDTTEQGDKSCSQKTSKIDNRDTKVIARVQTLYLDSTRSSAWGAFECIPFLLSIYFSLQLSLSLSILGVSITGNKEGQRERPESQIDASEGGGGGGGEFFLARRVNNFEKNAFF